MRTKRVFLPAVAALLSACGPSGPSGPPIEPINGLLLGQVIGTAGRPFGLGMSSRGEALALQLDRMTAGRFDLQTDSIANVVTLGVNPIDVSFTRGGARAYVTLLDGAKLFEVDMSNGRVIDSTTFGARHHRILMHPDDTRFWVTSIGGKIWSVSRISGQPIDSATVGTDIIRGISRNPTTGRLVLAHGYDAVSTYTGAGLDSLRSTTLGGMTQEVVHSKDGARVFVALEDANKVMVLNSTTLVVEDSVVFTATPISPFGMQLSRDGQTLLVSSAANGRIAVIDVPTLTVRRTLVPGGVPRRIVFSPNGALAFVANEGGWIDVIH